MNDFIVTNVNVIVNLLSKHCAYTFCCVSIRLIILAIFRLRGRRTKGWGGGGEKNLCECDPIETPYIHIHIQTSEKVLGSAFK